MNRDECKSLLMVYGGLGELCGLHKDDKELHDALCAMQENLEYAIVALMADGKGPAYRNSGITLSGTDWSKMTAPYVTKPVITCDVAKPKEGE